MTDFDETDVVRSGSGTGRGTRIVSWIIMAALALILVNIGIAAVGSKEKAAPPPGPTPAPTPVVTALPTAPAPRPSISTPPALKPTAAVLPSLPLPAPSRPGGLTYPLALGALTPGGDLVLADGRTGETIRLLQTHQPGAPITDISWDAANGIMYFAREGACPTVWRHQLALGREELFAGGRHPVVSPDGTRVAAIGTGCGPGGQQVEGVATYIAATGIVDRWIPAGSGGAAAGAVVIDVDWRPDGAALAVISGDDGAYSYKLVGVADPVGGDLAAAPDIPIGSSYKERFEQLEYVGPGRLLLAGCTCHEPAAATTWRLAVHDPADGSVLTVLGSTTPISSVAADARGEIRYLDGDEGAGGTLGATSLPGHDGQVSMPLVGQPKFLRIDW